MSSPLSLIKSSQPLHILYLAAGNAHLYFAKPTGTLLLESPSGLPHAAALAHFVSKAPTIPWVILVDQSEELFWGDVIPSLRGAAKKAWIERMAERAGSEGEYCWSELQGKSRSHPDKLRVLGYTLGRSERVSTWMDVLLGCRAQIRGVYAPVMLTSGALSLLGITPFNKDTDIEVLVTPHADGMRQTVLVAGKVRFSRLALHSFRTGRDWLIAICSETEKLREYLIGNGLLKTDRTGMQIYVVLPLKVSPNAAADMPSVYPKDRYQWIKSPVADLVFVAALAIKQPWMQLAPSVYRFRDLSVRCTRLIYSVCAACSAVALSYALFLAMQIWQNQLAINSAEQASAAALKQYQTIAKNFPPTPLTAAQLEELHQRWRIINATTPPEMRDLWLAAGQTLAKHPGMIIEKMDWAHAKPATAMLSADGAKEVATLILTGSIRGIASTDLRGTRDALSRLVQDFQLQPNLRAEITKKPLDLSAKATLSGSGSQASSELSFEVKLWQK